MADLTLTGGLAAPGLPLRSSVVRVLLVVLGLLNTGLGVLGIIVPGMPATVFFLVAGWFFARSSPRLHRWLHAHPRLGPYLEMARTRSMPRRARVLTILAIWAGIASSLALRLDAPLWWKAVLVAAGLCGTGFVATMRPRVRPRVRTQPGASILR